ncbi:MAG: AMP-binding protein, partial [Micromonosporaceae bacterium]
MTLLPGLEADVPDAVRIGGTALSTAALRAAASAVADRIAGAPVVAVDATPSLETVVAVLGGLLAG